MSRRRENERELSRSDDSVRGVQRVEDGLVGAAVAEHVERAQAVDRGCGQRGDLLLGLGRRHLHLVCQSLVGDDQLGQVVPRGAQRTQVREVGGRQIRLAFALCLAGGRLRAVCHLFCTLVMVVVFDVQQHFVC